MLHIGIPSTLFYYVQYPLWKTFFEELDVKIITSGKTTRQLLDYGVKEALADACVPIKVFFGHIMPLIGKVDYIFIPRIVCLNKKTVYCPKFLGLPDMIRYGIANVPPIIDVRIDNRERKDSLSAAFYKIGAIIGKTPRQVSHAVAKAKASQRKFQKLLIGGMQPLEAMDTVLGKVVENQINKASQADDPHKLTFAVVGYPYIIHDYYISSGVINKLHQMNIKVVTTDNIAPLFLKLQRLENSKRMFWTFSERTLRSASYFFKRKDIDGIIHLSAFGCGPDSIVDRFIQLKHQKTAERANTIPFMSLVVDEQSGEAGMATRLEAFVDMVKRKKGAFFHA